jgi:hypothetical protein
MDIEVRAELEALKDKDDMVHADQAVAWAKSHPKSKLHGKLEWDDRKAGHEYRLHQMRQLIVLHIRHENGEPRMINLSFDRVRGGGYREISDVVRSKMLSEIAENDALRELLRVRKKYGHLKRLVAVWKEVDRVEAKMVGRELTASPAA